VRALTDLSLAELEPYRKNPLFAGKTWKWSPASWSILEDTQNELEALGLAAVSFYRAIERLYLKSKNGEKILRNHDFKAPWVADYYDEGKPEWLVKHSISRQVLGTMPAVLRPDLLPTSNGFALTEWDAVPGGIGLTAFLNEIYLGKEHSLMVDSFGESLMRACGSNDDGDYKFAIVVSEEAKTYLPEMEWLAERLRVQNYWIEACSPSDLKITDSGVFLNGEKINLVYRFWELFDHEEIPEMRELAKLVEEEKLVVTPPMRPFQEEKLSLALFHHHRLQEFWEENLKRDELSLLRRVIPKTWILDPAPVPPGSTVDGPLVKGGLLGDWIDLVKVSKKERALVIKASGFHETAWGARSVVVGDDVSLEEWTIALQSVLNSYPTPISILQEFKKPVRLEHPVFADDKSVKQMIGRVRISPYFFVLGDKVKWSGTLATFCPADKKIIHGMKDGALMPCS
jgi:hypothetical protein